MTLNLTKHVHTPFPVSLTPTGHIPLRLFEQFEFEEYAPVQSCAWKTLFVIDEEKHGNNFSLLLFFNTSKQVLAPGGLNAACV